MKLLIDENIGKPITYDLAKLLAWHHLQPIVTHLIDFIGTAGESDAIWIPKAAEANWTIVTGDSASKSARDKLPDICAEYGVRHVIFSRAFCQLRQFEKVRAIVVLWPEFSRVEESPPGSRFKIWQGHPHPRLVDA